MNKHGFTLIELLVVIAIVGILSSVIYTNITGLRDRARITAGIRFDSSTLHSIGDQLAGEWLFDVPGSPLIDTSGFGLNGTVSGAVYATTSGYNGKGTYYFDGSNDYINVVSNFDFRNPFTISVWIKKGAGTTGFIVGKGNTMFARLSTNCPTNKINWGLLSTTWNEVCSKNTINQDTWTHIALVFDITRRWIYIDGKLDSNFSYSGTPDSTSGNFVIGIAPWDVGSLSFPGYIDNVRVYTSALSSSDIQKLYAESKASHEVAIKQ
ncbi:MAG: LamG-like jellyroll fold domain-containing protein [Candidatus Paceibacterota bacterium]|jgi:prepilin-type N-terminal cleavage/methylation domain-containing protein